MVSPELEFCFDVIKLAKVAFRPLLIERDMAGVKVTASTGLFHVSKIYSINQLYALDQERQLFEFADLEKKHMHEQLKEKFV